MESDDIEAIQNQIVAELRKDEPLSTRELQRRLLRSEYRLSRGGLGRILEDREWRRVERVKDDSAGNGWVLRPLWIDPKDLGPVILFVVQK